MREGFQSAGIRHKILHVREGTEVREISLKAIMLYLCCSIHCALCPKHRHWMI